MLSSPSSLSYTDQSMPASWASDDFSHLKLVHQIDRIKAAREKSIEVKNNWAASQFGSSMKHTINSSSSSDGGDSGYNSGKDSDKEFPLITIADQIREGLTTAEAVADTRAEALRIAKVDKSFYEDFYRKYKSESGEQNLSLRMEQHIGRGLLCDAWNQKESQRIAADAEALEGRIHLAKQLPPSPSPTVSTVSSRNALDGLLGRSDSLSSSRSASVVRAPMNSIDPADPCAAIDAFFKEEESRPRSTGSESVCMAQTISKETLAAIEGFFGQEESRGLQSDEVPHIETDRFSSIGANLDRRDSRSPRPEGVSRVPSPVHSDYTKTTLDGSKASTQEAETEDPLSGAGDVQVGLSDDPELHSARKGIMGLTSNRLDNFFRRGRHNGTGLPPTHIPYTGPGRHEKPRPRGRWENRVHECRRFKRRWNKRLPSMPLGTSDHSTEPSLSSASSSAGSDGKSDDSRSDNGSEESVHARVVSSGVTHSELGPTNEDPPTDKLPLSVNVPTMDRPQIPRSRGRRFWENRGTQRAGKRLRVVRPSLRRVTWRGRLRPE